MDVRVFTCVRMNINAASMIQLTPDVLRVSDPDSSPAELMFSSLRNSSEGGHLEHQDSPGRFVPRDHQLPML